MEKNILLTIEYDGSVFHGWQRQPEALTVQGMLEEALSTVCGNPVEINGTSRTDAGVHAYGQRASFKGDFGIPTERIAYAVNNALLSDKWGEAAGAVRVLKAEDVSPDFHARFDSKGKTYVYKIYNMPEMDVFRRNYCYHIPDELDIGAMQKAAKLIEGTHDFKCFEAAGGQERETTVRTISGITVERGNHAGSGDYSDAERAEGGRGEDGYVNIRVTGDGFLYNMVRIITGTLAEVGLGKRSPEEMTEIIEGKDRTKAGHTAPPQGLYLEQIYY
ncbi:MAG: tRNA pseudouridine(38-40) synthase TruA [Firmicutes bacterium]|nr:tRNA pseudouridine(38-40) synthase TruA [Bacillota bacterium]